MGGQERERFKEAPTPFTSWASNYSLVIIGLDNWRSFLQVKSRKENFKQVKSSYKITITALGKTQIYIFLICYILLIIKGNVAKVHLICIHEISLTLKVIRVKKSLTLQIEKQKWAQHPTDQRYRVSEKKALSSSSLVLKTSVVSLSIYTTIDKIGPSSTLLRFGN